MAPAGRRTASGGAISRARQLHQRLTLTRGRLCGLVQGNGRVTVYNAPNPFDPLGRRRQALWRHVRSVRLRTALLELHVGGAIE